MTTPFNNLQPSLAIQEVTLALGIFPAVSDGGGFGYGDTIGFIYGFAGNFAPNGSLSSDGQQIQITSNTALFSILGTTYGGNGTSNYDLPDLEGQAIIGAGGGYTLGEMTGSSTVTLTPSNLPTGGGQPFDNLQPSLPIETLICTGGVFPTRGGDSGSAAFIGEIANFAGNIVPEGWALANGQSMSIGSNTALFSVIGTLYGGDGTSNFDLPNLQGKAAVGSGGDGGIPVGTLYGEASTTLTSSELPPVSAPIDDDQPSLAVEYLIATAGIFPSQGGGGSSFDADTPILGQIVEFAGNFVPSGYALANGELLPIGELPALFAVIGTTYGGDGVNDFALPDFTGRTAIGAGGTTVEGEESGADTVTLTADNIPACYLEGTRIMTVAGEVAIEMLRIGDRVVTASGGTCGIVWTGHRRVDVGAPPAAA